MIGQILSGLAKLCLSLAFVLLCLVLTTEALDINSFKIISIEASENFDPVILRDFDYSNFISTDGLTMLGSTARYQNRLRLNPSAQFLTGTVWIDEKLFVQGGFQTTFQFQIGDEFDGGADGFAFVVQNNSQTAVGNESALGSGIGYTGIANSIAVEFDTIDNTSGTFNDTTKDHISVHTNGQLANDSDHNFSLGYTQEPLIFTNGSVHTVTIQYTPGTLSVFLNNLTTPVLTTSIDIAETLSLDGGRAWVGFTSATGASSEYHDILNWQFSTSINYPDFRSSNQMNVVGHALITDNHKLRLTPANSQSVGGAWYSTPLYIQDGFETTFEFQITDEDGGGADGMAFVIQNNSLSKLGSNGEGMGYSGITNSLAIEIDTYQNFYDPNDNHISVQSRFTRTNTFDHFASLGVATNINDISDGLTHTITVTYVPTTLKIQVDDLPNPSLEVSIDLSKTLNLNEGHAWLGFTAGTASAWEAHDVLSWSFDNSVATPRITRLYLPVIVKTDPVKLCVRGVNTGGIDQVMVKDLDGNTLLTCTNIPDGMFYKDCGTFPPVDSYLFVYRPNNCNPGQDTYQDAAAGATVRRRVFCGSQPPPDQYPCQ